MPPHPLTRACYLEDLALGLRYAGGTAAVDVAGIKAFAAAFDPQPFHLDEDAARTSIFGRLVASGWHTMALTMRMLLDGELRSLWGLVGLGADELRWPRPCFPATCSAWNGRYWSCAPPHPNPIAARRGLESRPEISAGRSC